MANEELKSELEKLVAFPVNMGPGWVMNAQPILVANNDFFDSTAPTCISFFTHTPTGNTLELTVSILTLKVVDWRYECADEQALPHVV